MLLSDDEKQGYLQQVIIPNFTPHILQDVYSVIFDWKYEVVACSNLSAQSMGKQSWQGLCGASYKDYQSIEVAREFFGNGYNKDTQDAIHHYAKTIYELQTRVFSEKKIVSFIDMLPYDNKFKSYLVTYIPLYHPIGEVIAIQSVAVKSRLFNYQEQLKLPIAKQEGSKYMPQQPLTPREQEIMFLLANNVTPIQIAQILNNSRSTVGAQTVKLCNKFGLHGTNIKLLSQVAFQHEYHLSIPKSLYTPHVIILDASSE